MSLPFTAIEGITRRSYLPTRMSFPLVADRLSPLPLLPDDVVAAGAIRTTRSDAVKGPRRSCRTGTPLIPALGKLRLMSTRTQVDGRLVTAATSITSLPPLLRLAPVADLR